jgi:hypothetical protein
MISLRRKPTILQAPPSKPDPVLMRFLTHGGAIVTVTRESGTFPYWARCRGCGWNDDRSSEQSARDIANSHSDECRSMPRRTVTR